MGDGKTWRAVNEREIKRDEGSFRDWVSNGYGERQYEGGVMEEHCLCVLHSLLKHVFIWEEHVC